MTQVDKLRIFFVLPADDTVEKDFSSDVKLGFQLVSKYGGHAEWMKPLDCIDHEPQEKDVFVFDKFEGNAFEALRQNSSKHVVIGARCLLTCLTNSRCIPPNPHPIFSEGMRDLYITSSGFDHATKKQIQEKVQFMSGHYDSFLRGIITHLVAHNNLSSKAIQAYKGNIKIMKLSWIEDVWQQSLRGNVNGSDEIFSKHLSPLFHNLHITTSGIPKREKDALKETIEKHGGHFMGTLEERLTNIVLLTKPEGEKYKFAKAWNIPCVKPVWVHHSVDAKAILSFKNYVVDSDKPKSSTPNKENCTANFSANFTANLSVINNLDSNKVVSQVDETAATLSARSDFQTPKVNSEQSKVNRVNSEQSKVNRVNSEQSKVNRVNSEQSKVNRVNSEQSKVKNAKSSNINVINNVLLKNLKDAGLFLDGLNILLHGFHPEEMEKLKRILNKGGATRFNELSESVTHIIAGRKDDSNLTGLTKFGAYVLSIDWLVESMKMKCKASEGKYLMVDATNPSEPPSPMSKQGAQLLSQTEGKVSHFSLEEKNENEKLSQIDELLCRYNASQPGEPLDQPDLNPPASNMSEASTSKTLECSTDEFFAGLSFFLSSDLCEEEIKYLEDLITERKGEIVGKRHLGVPDYAIVPVIGASLTEVTAKEVVNIYFVKDCCVENCLLTPRYYHQPVAFVKNASPLKNCVISVSNYVQGEREFMEMMIEALDGVAQSLLARKPKQGALKSTHLVCAQAQGQKYEGAVRWGLPVVHHDWLLKCAALGIRVSEKPYLIGDSKLLEKTPSEATLPSTSKTNSAESERMPPPSQVHFLSQTEMPAPPKKTPVHGAIARVKATETPKNGSPDFNRTITPTSPYGAFYGKGTPTPRTRKRIYKWMNQGAEFPLDPPSKPFENEKDSTPVSQLISRHLEMLKRKPEELPPDSPLGLPSKKLNIDDGKENESKGSVVSALQKIRNLEKHTSKELRSPPPKKAGVVSEEKPVNVMSESQPRSEVGWEDPAEKEAALENLRKAALHKAKVFMFSCISDQLEEARQLVENAGGVVSPLSYFDKKATHLIAGNLTRAEKLMSSIAAGLWILHPSYLETLKEGKDVNEVSEEDFEWGSTKQSFRLNLLSANAKEFASCSYFWRVAIRNGEPRPFKGMSILLHLSEAKYDSFKRLIEAGDGKVVLGTPPHYQKADATLCVCEASNSKAIDYASLARRKIPCVALVYISDVLLRKKDAVEKNLMPEFSKYWLPNKQCS